MRGKSPNQRYMLAAFFLVLIIYLYYGHSFMGVSSKADLSPPQETKTFDVVSTSPQNGAAGIKLYRSIEVVVNQDVGIAQIKVTDPKEAVTIPGTIEIAGSRISFKPARAFLPGRSYKVELAAVAKEQVLLKHFEFSFTTMELGDKYWVDVTLGRIHIVRVYKGTQLIRHMLASGGKSTTPTPLGYFYTQDRGHSFWSPRFGEGASYWVRLVGQILVHSVPKNSQWMTKEEEHSLLGLPASHGCIRLDEKDAKWFFEKIPQGTLVIIHQ